MINKLPNIEHKSGYSKFVESSDGIKMILMNRDLESLSDMKAYDTFIKACERQVRNSMEYSNFIAFIKGVVGLDFCQMCSNIMGDDATIEMHHNFFTLYDIVSIITECFLQTNRKVNTFTVSDAVIDEHYELNIQVVMAAITSHEAIHNRDLFVNMKQAYGNLTGFIEKYGRWFTDDQKYKVYRYINMCKDNESFDTGVFDIVKVERLIKDDF